MTIFKVLYVEGVNIEGDETISRIGDRLGIVGAFEKTSNPAVKEALKANTEEAIRNGVFGVPAFVIDGELFWGDEATGMFLDFLKNPDLFNEREMLRLSNLPMCVER